ncbi:MAG: hypothetical protein LWX56_11920 [Ignavibacteria bacterium]|nr:hypothetical protein [Ignavibacteria bacterium]
MDDSVDEIDNSLVYFIALKKAHVSVEYHVFSTGGHAFGLREDKQPVAEWTNLLLRWVYSLKLQ